MPKDLRSFIAEVEKKTPQEFVRIDKQVNPANFDITALLQNLYSLNKYPMVLFEKPLNGFGQVGPQFITNVFGSRQRCALAIGHPLDLWRTELSLAFAEREKRKLPPLVVSRDHAPVKDIVYKGDEVDLRVLPLAMHHRMDAGTYMDMAPVMKDPDEGFYDVSFAKNMYIGPRDATIYVFKGLHLGLIRAKYEKRGQPAPIAIILGHHPAFYLGSLAQTPFGNNDYETIGSFLGESLRLVNSETWGNDFLVPSDAEVIVEGYNPPNEYEVADPFGDIEGYYYPQQLHPAFKVTAITMRRDAIFQDVHSGNREHRIIGGIPKEGSLLNYLRQANPKVKAVHFPLSGCCRFSVYICMEKTLEGESRAAGLIALGYVRGLKLAVVVSEDIDVFNEEEVIWSVITRVQADRSVDILKDMPMLPTDPSIIRTNLGAKWLIDATKPVDRPFEPRLDMPQSALERMKPRDLIPDDVLEKLR